MKRQQPRAEGADNAVIYTRVSTDDQEDNYSLPTQIAACLEYAAKRGYTVLEKFSDVDTGMKGNRKNLNKMLDYVYENPVDVVIVYDVDRVMRNSKEHVVLELQLEHEGARVEYVIGQYDNTPEGQLSKQLKIAIAEYENRQRTERIRRGRRGKAQAGFVVTPPLRRPYGYDVESKPHQSWLVINELEAPVVREIFTLLLEGNSLGAIARTLSERGVPTRGDGDARIDKRVRYGQWNPSSIGHIVHNPVYKGEWQFGKTTVVRRAGKKYQEPAPASSIVSVPAPAIITPHEWETAQAQLGLNKQHSKRNAKRDYLLRGRITCTCGRVWQGFYKSFLDRAYYRCGTREYRQWLRKESCTLAGGVRQERLEDAVWDAVEHVLLDPEQLNVELARQRSVAHVARDKIEQRLAAITAAQAEVQRKLGLLLDQALTGGFAPELIESRRQQFTGQLQELTLDAQRTQASLDMAGLGPLQEQAVLDYAAQLRGALTEVTNETKRQVLDLLQVKVKVVSQTEFSVSALLPVRAEVTLPLSKTHPRHHENGSIVMPLEK